MVCTGLLRRSSCSLPSCRLPGSINYFGQCGDEIGFPSYLIGRFTNDPPHGVRGSNPEDLSGLL